MARLSRRLDRTLFWVVVGLVVVAIGFAGYFGWTVYQDKLFAESSNPQMRIANAVKAQIAKSPNDALLRVRYGEALAAAGKTQEAIDQFNAALKIDPKHTGALLDLGFLAERANNMTAATQYFQKVVDLTASGGFENVDARRDAALFQLGQVALSQNTPDKAIGYFKEALRVKSDASDTYYYLAVALDRAGQTSEAIHQMLVAVAFDPNFSQAHYYLGQLYLKQGDKVSASHEFATAATIDPNAADPKQALAQFGNPADLLKQAQASKDTSAAITTLRIIRNIDPNNVAAMDLYASLVERQGDLKSALTTYQDALRAQANDAQAKAGVARLTPLVAKRDAAKKGAKSKGKTAATAKKTTKK